MGNFYVGFGGLGAFVIVAAIASPNHWTVLIGGLAIAWCLPIIMGASLLAGKIWK